MKEIYYLNKSELPTITVPHDCVVKDIKLNGNELVFAFEDDISKHDSIKFHKPDAKSLIMRYHLLYDTDDIRFFIENKPNRLFRKVVYRETDLTKAKNALAKFTKNRLEYLSHDVGYCSVIVRLWSFRNIIFDLTADYVELEWLM